MTKSIMQERKRCYLTGSCEDLHRHHIFQGCRRKTSEEWGCWVWLRDDLHNMSGQGVHSDKELDARLKDACQRRFEALYGHDCFMAVFGKNYIRPEYDEQADKVEGWFEVTEDLLPY